MSAATLRYSTLLRREGWPSRLGGECAICHEDMYPLTMIYIGTGNPIGAVCISCKKVVRALFLSEEEE